MSIVVSKIEKVPVMFTVKLTLDEEGACAIIDLKNSLLYQTCYDDDLVELLSNIIKECV